MALAAFAASLSPKNVAAIPKTACRFIEVWEGDMLTKMFSDVRNPFAHGPGQSPMPTLSPEQTNWTIETAMAWIKSLVRHF